MLDASFIDATSNILTILTFIVFPDGEVIKRTSPSFTYEEGLAIFPFIDT